jgi:hypothetical protein
MWMGFIERKGVCSGRNMQLHSDKAKASGLDDGNWMIPDPTIGVLLFCCPPASKLEGPDRLQKT